MICVLLNLLTCVLWARMWLVLVNTLCEPKKNGYFAVVGCSINIDQMLLVDGIFEFFCVHPGFICTCSTSP